MLKVFIAGILDLFLVNINFCVDFSGKMQFKLLLLLETHHFFDKSQNHKEVSPCTSQSAVFGLESSFELTPVVFEHPSSGNRNELFMGVVSASFKLLLSG